MASRTLQVEIIGDSKSLERALGRAGQASDTTFTKISKGATVAGLALTAGLGLAAKVGFDELAEGQKVTAQTAARLIATGDAAHVTAKQIEELAASQSKLTGIDDEAVQAGENMLLTFRNIRNEVGKNNDIFNQATVAVEDMATAMNDGAIPSAEQLSTTSIRIGKALNDPIKGMTALGRVGVQFTAGQKELIKSLVDSGDRMGAQKVILKELNREFGGSAKAAGETLPGQLNKAKNAFDEMAAGVVVVLLPALTTLAQVTAKVAQFFTEHQTAAKVLGASLVALAGILLTVGAATKLYAAGQAIITAATAAWTAVQWLLNAALTENPIGIVVVALAALVGGLILAWKNSETFRKIVTGAFDAVKAAATFVLNFFRDNWKTIAVLISGPFAPLVALATDAFGIRSKLVAAANAILDFFRSNWKTIAVIISGPFAPLVALATNAFGIRSALVNAFGAIVDGIRDKVGNLIAVVAGIPKGITRALGDLSSLLYNAGVQIVQGLISGITDKLGDLWGLVSGIGGKIASLKGPISQDRKLLVPQGRAIIQGLVTGMQDRMPDVDKLSRGIAPAIAGGIGTVPTPAVGSQFSDVSTGGVTSSFGRTNAQTAVVNGGGGMAEITVPVYLDGAQITQVVRREMLRFEKRNGTSAV